MEDMPPQQPSQPPRPRWVKDKTVHPDYADIQCMPYNDYKDHKNDMGCYVLIKVDFEFYEIQLAVCNYNHEILKVFHGKRAQDIYNTLFDFEKKNNLSWFTEKQHIAYIGKELKKAEIALAMGNSGYYQE